MTRDEEDKVQAVLAKLSPEDGRLVEAQGYCPIQIVNRLGSMGTPVKVIVKGQPVFLCCSACVNQSLANAKETLTKVEELKAMRKGAPGKESKPLPTSPATDRRESKDAKAKAALAKLSAEDRRLAELQGFCPQTGEPLGSMGVPVKLTLNGQPLFLCCNNCVDETRAHPDQALARVSRTQGQGESRRPEVEGLNHDRKTDRVFHSQPLPGHDRGGCIDGVGHLCRAQHSRRCDPRSEREPGHRLH